MGEGVRKISVWNRFGTVKRDERKEDDYEPRDVFLLKNVDIKVPAKRTVTIRLDDDVLDWFKRQGKGYQTRINKVLRGYMEVYENEQETKRSAVAPRFK